MTQASKQMAAKIRANRLANSVNNIFKGLKAKSEVDHAGNVIVNCNSEMTTTVVDVLKAYGKGDKNMVCLTFESGHSMVFAKRA